MSMNIASQNVFNPEMNLGMLLKMFEAGELGFVQDAGLNKAMLEGLTSSDNLFSEVLGRQMAMLVQNGEGSVEEAEINLSDIIGKIFPDQPKIAQHLLADIKEWLTKENNPEIPGKMGEKSITDAESSGFPAAFATGQSHLSFLSCQTNLSNHHQDNLSSGKLQAQEFAKVRDFLVKAMASIGHQAGEIQSSTLSEQTLPLKGAAVLSDLSAKDAKANAQDLLKKNHTAFKVSSGADQTNGLPKADDGLQKLSSVNMPQSEEGRTPFTVSDAKIHLKDGTVTLGATPSRPTSEMLHYRPQVTQDYIKVTHQGVTITEGAPQKEALQTADNGLSKLSSANMPQSEEGRTPLTVSDAKIHLKEGAATSGAPSAHPSAETLQRQRQIADGKPSVSGPEFLIDRGAQRPDVLQKSDDVSATRGFIKTGDVEEMVKTQDGNKSATLVLNKKDQPNFSTLMSEMENNVASVGKKSTQDHSSAVAADKSAFDRLRPQMDAGIKATLAETDALKSQAEHKMSSKASILQAPKTSDNMSVNTTASAGQMSEKSAASEISPAPIINRVAAEFRENLMNEGGRVKIILTPPSLGTLEMDVSVQNGKVRVMLLADSRDVQRTLTGNIDALKGALQHQGLTIERCDVMMQDRREEYSQGFNGQPAFGRDQGQREGLSRGYAADEQLLAPISGQPSPKSPLKPGLAGAETISLFV